MSTPSVTTRTTTTESDGAQPRAVRRYLAAVPLIAGALLVAAMVLARPWGERNVLDYESLAPLRDGMWTGILLDAIGMTAIGVGLALVVAQLARRRGAVWAEIGGVLTAVGGVLFALGIYAFGSLVWYVTDTAVVSASDGAALLEHALVNPEHGVLLQTLGFLTFTLGTVLLCVALLRARTIGRAVPIIVLALTVLLFVLPSGAADNRAHDIVQAVQLVAIAVIGVRFLVAAARSTTTAD